MATTFGKRRAFFIILLVVAVTGLVVVCRALEDSLRPYAVYTGLVLFFILLLLTLFNLRKKLPFIPLFRASTWLQIHIYTGLLSVALFVVHVGFRMPNGILEGLLTAVFVIVTVSGIAGLFISRWLPPMLTHSGESIMYEHVPALRRKLADEAEDIIVSAETELESTSLRDFYALHLRPYFRRNHGIWLVLTGARRLQRRLESRMKELHRYLTERELPVLERLRDLADTKRNLDYQYSGQRLLKLWLFVHIPFTYSLLLLALAHGVLALSYVSRF